MWRCCQRTYTSTDEEWVGLASLQVAAVVHIAAESENARSGSDSIEERACKTQGPAHMWLGRKGSMCLGCLLRLVVLEKSNVTPSRASAEPISTTTNEQGHLPSADKVGTAARACSPVTVLEGSGARAMCVVNGYSEGETFEEKSWIWNRESGVDDGLAG